MSRRLVVLSLLREAWGSRPWADGPDPTWCPWAEGWRELFREVPRAYRYHRGA